MTTMSPLRAATIAISQRLEEVLPTLPPVDRAVLSGQLASLALNAAASVDPGSLHSVVNMPPVGVPHPVDADHPPADFDG